MSTRELDGASVQGRSTISTGVVMADDFVLGTDDEQVSVSYATYGIAPPLLTYHNEADPRGVGTYQGAQVRTEDHELGRLVTVTLAEIPDAEKYTLTLVVPDVSLDSDQAANGIDIESLVIWTTHREGRQARGPIQTFEERRVRGTAKHVGA